MKKYIPFEMKIVYLEAEDVVTASYIHPFFNEDKDNIFDDIDW